MIILYVHATNELFMLYYKDDGKLYYWAEWHDEELEASCIHLEDIRDHYYNPASRWYEIIYDSGDL
jgi:hypothetical protein